MKTVAWLAVRGRGDLLDLAGRWAAYPDWRDFRDRLPLARGFRSGQTAFVGGEHHYAPSLRVGIEGAETMVLASIAAEAGYGPREGSWDFYRCDPLFPSWALARSITAGEEPKRRC